MTGDIRFIHIRQKTEIQKKEVKPDFHLLREEELIQLINIISVQVGIKIEK
jgi:hypothetical protein